MSESIQPHTQTNNQSVRPVEVVEAGKSSEHVIPIYGEGVAAAVRPELITEVPRTFPTAPVEAVAAMPEQPSRFERRIKRLQRGIERKSPVRRAKYTTLAGRAALAGLALAAPQKGLIDRVSDPFVDGGQQTIELLDSSSLVETEGEILTDLLHGESSDVGLLNPEVYEDKEGVYDEFLSMDSEELAKNKDKIVATANAHDDPYVEEMLEENTVEGIQDKKTVNAMADVFAKLDAGETDQILTDAKEIIDANPDQYMTDTEIEGVRSAIDSADTNEDLVKAIGPTLTSYGKEIDVSAMGDDVYRTRALVASILDLVSVLPREFVRDDMQFARFRITPDGDGLKAAYYHNEGGGESENNEIVLNASWLMKTLQPVMKITDQSLNSVIGHEAGHSYLEGPRPAPVDGGAESRFVLFALNHMLMGNSKDPSQYAIFSDVKGNGMDGEEARAEIAADVFGGGWNHPDDRGFDSPVNADRLKLMADIETKYPGSINVLIGRTMDKVATFTKGDFLQYSLFLYLVAPHIVNGANFIRRHRQQRNRRG